MNFALTFITASTKEIGAFITSRSCKIVSPIALIVAPIASLNKGRVESTLEKSAYILLRSEILSRLNIDRHPEVSLDTSVEA